MNETVDSDTGFERNTSIVKYDTTQDPLKSGATTCEHVEFSVFRLGDEPFHRGGEIFAKLNFSGAGFEQLVEDIGFVGLEQ